MAGEDGRGQGGDINPPIIRASADSRANGSNNGMVRGSRTAPPPRLRDTAAENNSAGPQLRQSDGADGANGAKPKNGMHPRHKYGLVAPKYTEGDRSNAGPWSR